jgi:hypothetical protein
MRNGIGETPRAKMVNAAMLPKNSTKYSATR